MTERSAWFSLRSSLWFIPAIAVLTAFACAMLLVQIDQHFNEQLKLRWPDALQLEPDGARQILATIANSMITVAGVVFSVTIVALSLTANQYSPRVLRNFMRDRLNQTVLGIFTGAFIYSLLVLQAVGSLGPSFVPLLAAWAGILIAVASIGFLIAFIHRTAISIQVSDIMDRIATETVAALGAIQHMENAGGDIVAGSEELGRLQWQSVASTQSGYVQDIDTKNLFRLACEYQVVIRVENPVGEFVVVGRPLVSVSGAVNADTDFEKRIRKYFGISSYRTIEQDPAFGVRQIVDIALRALSPGVNDATTAINCVDYLSVILHHAVYIQISGDVHMEGEAPRLQLRHRQPEHLVDIALNEIRQNAQMNVSVFLRLLRLLRQLLECTQAASIRERLQRHAHLVAEAAKRSVPEPADKAEVENALRKALAAEPTTPWNNTTKLAEL